MNQRALLVGEAENLASLNDCGFPSALLFITQTGLEKAILDATASVRELLKNSGVHDYSLQGQGNEHKRLLEGVVHTAQGPKDISVSLYRPKTKQGDPRIWFSRFRDYASPDDVCAIFVKADRIHVINLTSSSLAQSLSLRPGSPAVVFFEDAFSSSNRDAEALLSKLRSIAQSGPLRAVCEGPTAVGRSIEDALEISINSSKSPDFRNRIEIKAGRAPIVGRENRVTLFAQVPDWNLSRLKSSRAILDEFGYERGDTFKLYCTISTRSPNSQGLVFEIAEATRWLCERSTRSTPPDVAVWRLDKLETRLREKHRETFWIKATSIQVGGREHFNLVSAIHTKNPNIPQLERMLGEGTITMDHLIKRQPNGRVSEKGPLFKIERPHIGELFLGLPKTYSLR